MALIDTKIQFKPLLVLCFMAFGLLSRAQSAAPDLEALKPNPEKEKMFLPYLATRHGGTQGLEAWKKENIYQYYKELWYYCESFYIKRNYLEKGEVLNELIIDISRFESSRKESEEAVVILPGFKDALVLLPANKLVYKPNY